MKLKIKSKNDFLESDFRPGDEYMLYNDGDKDKKAVIWFHLEQKGFGKYELDMLLNPYKYKEFMSLQEGKRNITEELKLGRIEDQLFNN